MYMPGFGIQTGGRPDECVSRWKNVTVSRMPPRNSGMISLTRVVSANCPSSIARNASTFVNALVKENNEKTESCASGTAPALVAEADVRREPESGHGGRRR